MSKPNSSMTVAQMKAYIREKKINHPEVRLGMKRGDMIAGLKKAGHWDDSKSEKKPPKTKNPAKKTPAKKKAVPKGSHRMPDGSIMKDEDHKGAPPKNESPQRQETTKATTTDALFNLGTDISSMIGSALAQTLPVKLERLKQQIFSLPLSDVRRMFSRSMKTLNRRLVGINSATVTSLIDIINRPDRDDKQKHQLVDAMLVEVENYKPKKGKVLITFSDLRRDTEGNQLIKRIMETETYWWQDPPMKLQYAKKVVNKDLKQIFAAREPFAPVLSIHDVVQRLKVRSKAREIVEMDS